MVITLRDSINSDLDAIIITEQTLASEIQDIIDELKESWGDDYPDDMFEEIVNALPEDCEVYAAWCNDFNTVWY